MKRYEIEQKYRLCSPRRIRGLLKKFGAVQLRSGWQDNAYYDLDGKLKSMKRILRLRKTGAQAFLTLKGPRILARFTKRPEFETEVDWRQTREILTMLGYRVYRQYRKRREEFRLAGCVVSLDRLAGSRWFLEIEGQPRNISRLAAKLGFTNSDREERSYLAILFPYDGIDHRAK